jgi:hypothetical protein
MSKRTREVAVGIDEDLDRVSTEKMAGSAGVGNLEPERREDQGLRNDPSTGLESYDYSRQNLDAETDNTMDPWYGAQHGGRTGQSAQGDEELHSPDTTEGDPPDSLGEETEGEGDTFEPHSWSGEANDDTHAEALAKQPAPKKPRK